MICLVVLGFYFYVVGFELFIFNLINSLVCGFLDCEFFFLVSFEIRLDWEGYDMEGDVL